MKICAHPDCDRKLYVRNKTGLCRKHNHADGICKCFQCTGEIDASIADSRTLTSRGISRSDLPDAPPSSDRPISLVRAPWEVAP